MCQPQPNVNRRLQAGPLVVAKRWPSGTARVRWNEYADDDHEEAISTFVEVEAAVQHFPGAEMVLVRVSHRGRPASCGAMARRKACDTLGTDRQAGTGKLAAGDVTCPKRMIS